MKFDEYLKAKIKNKKAINTIKLFIAKKGIVGIDEKDVTFILKKSRIFRFVTGVKADSGKNAKCVILGIEIPEDATLNDVKRIETQVTKYAHPDAHVIWGAKISKVKTPKIWALYGW